jgi:hypothetical protein
VNNVLQSILALLVLNFILRAAFVAVHFNFSPLSEHCFARGRMLRRAKSLSTLTKNTKISHQVLCASSNWNHFLRGGWQQVGSDSRKENLNWTIREQCACVPREESIPKSTLPLFFPQLFLDRFLPSLLD